MTEHPSRWAPAAAGEPAPSTVAEAQRRRRRVPYWAVPVLAALPLWAYVYVGTLSPPPAGDVQDAAGLELYARSGCAGCHGAGGSGSATVPGFTDGRIFQTWPSFVEHVEWVRLGSLGWRAERGGTYGASGTPVGGGMPAFGEDRLSDRDLLLVVRHERMLGGANPSAEDAAALDTVARLMEDDPELSLEDALADIEADDPGRAAGEGGGRRRTGAP